jgi:glutamyl/glutaminyl-tRNA synthetase
MSVRVRFAPSPTGYLHVGGVRTAIFNWLYARKHGGKFILRIDDTDLKRNREEAVQIILDGLKWAGLNWDEGPEVGGDYGPYYQSQRMDRYKAAADKLIAAGRAVWMKKEAGGPPPAWKIEKLKKAGKWDEDLAQASADPNPALYFKIHPGEPTDCDMMDAVWGKYHRPADMLHDYVLMRGDGSPTYNFASTIDDIDLKITHVIRGEDHLANTPKQIRLFEALGAPVPVFAHLPMIHNDKGEKISKRRDPVAVTLYQGCGLLPEGLFNFLTLLGWSPGEDRELMTKEEMINFFSLDRIKHAPAQFTLKRAGDLSPEATDEERVKWLAASLPGTKLEWMNHEYMKKLTMDDLYARVKPFLDKQNYGLEKFSETYIKAALLQERDRARTLLQLAQNVKLFFVRPTTLDPKAVEKVLNKNNGWANLEQVKMMLEGVKAAGEFNDAAKIHAKIEALATTLNAKMGDVAQPVRVALSGTMVSPPIDHTLVALGPDESLARINWTLSQKK